jgi:hypothetical protein
MSEQFIVGTAPTAPEGREMYFPCADSWYALCEAIDGLVKGIKPYQTMSAEAAESLAVILTHAQLSGRLRVAVEGAVSGLFDGNDDAAKREANFAAHLMEQAQQFVDFLAACGGYSTD